MTTPKKNPPLPPGSGWVTPSTMERVKAGGNGSRKTLMAGHPSRHELVDGKAIKKFSWEE